MLKETSSVVTSKQIRDALRDGKGIYLTNCTIQPVDEAPKIYLPSDSHIIGEIKAIGCRFETQIHLRNTTFKRNITFEGTEFHESVDFLNCRFQQEVDFRNTKFIKSADFSESIFERSGERADFPSGKTYFDGVEFSQTAIFSRCGFARASFNRAVFSDNSEFLDTIFEDESYFVGAVFAGEVSFSLSNSKGSYDAYFNDAGFAKNVDFARCSFTKAYFNNVVFGGNALFEDTRFGIIAYFRNTEFFGEANFSRSASKKPDEGAETANTAIFDRAQFLEKTDFSGRKFGKARFCDSIFHNAVSLSRENFEGQIDFTRAVFKKAPAKSGDITDVMFEENSNVEAKEYRAKGVYSLAQACLDSDLSEEADYLFDRAGKAFEKLYKETKKQEHYDNVITSYRLAEKSYDSVKEQDKAGKVYKNAMDFKRKNRNPRQTFFLKRAAEWTWLTIMKTTCDYGESIPRFALWVLGIISFFALAFSSPNIGEPKTIYTLLPLFSMALAIPLVIALSICTPRSLIYGWVVFASLAFTVLGFVLSLFVKIDSSSRCIFLCLRFREFHPVIRGFYFSLITFTTLGFGDIVPSNHMAMVCVSIEVLFGYMMFGVLVTLLARKIMR